MTAKLKNLWREMLSPIFRAIVLVIIIRTLIVQPFYIPSGSMESTLLVGDNIFATKYAYGYSKYSFVFDLPFASRIFARAPERGDVIVFRLPSDPSVDYVKRLIGLPGDTVQVRDGVLFINGEQVPRRSVAPYVVTTAYGAKRAVPRYQETLPNGATFDVLDQVSGGTYDNTPPFLVPEGEYFFMGDNRDNSRDSRNQWRIGTIPFENLVGKASFVFFSIEPEVNWWEFWRWADALRYSRTFMAIK